MAKDEKKSLDELVLNAFREMQETKLHSKIVTPLLKRMGVSYVRYLHGSQERGKDFVYISTDMFGDPCLEVCQVKNSPFSGKSASKTNTIALLNQLIQCRETEVLNPKTLHKEKPQNVVLWTTYPLPDKDTADAKSFLEKIGSGPFKIIGPEKFVSLVKKYLPNIYHDLAFPGKGLARSIMIYLNAHHEASAFDIAQKRNIADFFVDIGIVNQIEVQKGTQVSSNRITPEELEHIHSIQSTLFDGLIGLAKEHRIPLRKIRCMTDKCWGRVIKIWRGLGGKPPPRRT